MISIPGRIPIQIYPLFWLMAFLIGWINSGGNWLGIIVWVIVIVFSVLIHEFGHALTALAFGQEARIELVGLGGLTHRKGGRLSLWKEFIIVLNGPLAGFLLFIIASILLKQAGENPKATLFNEIVYITAIANLFWTIVNLLPVHPLDGGRLLSIIMESLFGLGGVRAAYIISGMLSLLLSLFLFVNQMFLGGALFLMLAFESYRAWQGSALMSVLDDDENLQSKFRQAEEDLQAGRQEDAKAKLWQVRQEAPGGVIFMGATEYLAHILANEGSMKEVYDLLFPMKKDLSIDSLRLLQQAAYQTGAWKDTIEVGNLVYQSYPNYDTALLNALSYALLDEVKPCVGWLQRAISDGLPKPIVVLHREEFDHVRNAEAFQTLQRNITG